MKCIKSPTDFALTVQDDVGTCITIGNFDGVHVGHQSLLRRTLEKAKQYKLLPAVITFWPHPLAVLAGLRAPALITPQAERARLFAEHGMALSLELPFTRDIAALSPEEFIKHVIVPLRCRKLVIGYDFSLGKNRAGNVDILQMLGERYGFTVEQMPPIIALDAVVSSTRVRDFVRAGDVWEMQSLLGRYYAIEGKVVHGHGRGVGLGFPTANIQTEYATLPKQGVYATWVTGVSDYALPAVTNIGYVPTFENKELSIESFFLEGAHDVYGKDIRLFFVQRIRDEQKFNGVEELKTRIAKDVDIARNVLSAVPQP